MGAGMLTDDQKSTRLDISRYLLSHYEDDAGNFIKRVVTQDETWVYHFDPESKMQSEQWKHPVSPILIICSMRRLLCVFTTYVTENKENYLENLHLPSIMPIVFASFKLPNCQSVFKYLSLYWKLFKFA